ncbi:MAG TPA: aminopeptidase P family protein [Flavobacteriaceae bacterium]|nr:aminopeptidase P family protein [Flavobacteriaceae bacterium]
MTVKEKLAALRAEMKKNNIDAFIVFSADPHMSEYLPEAWQEREWLSGFTGSYGFVVVTKDKAGLWTDGRYFTQAKEQLQGTEITMFKDKVIDAVDYVEWIISVTSKNAKIAVNALATSHASWTDLKTKLEKNKRQLINKPLLNEVWKDRASEGMNPVFVQPISRAGESVLDKLARIREKMKEENASVHIVSSLDDVAWTLNLRGSDVECNPVFLSYLLITPEKAILFVKTEKLNEEAISLMQESNVQTQEYESFFPHLKTLKQEKIWLSNNTNQAVFEAVEDQNEIMVAPVPGNLMKAVKNKTELKGFETVMLKDGVAMVNFLYWLTDRVGKEKMTEYSVSRKLLEFRQQQENFVGVSFETIVGYKGNGAIIHYAPPSKGSAEIRAEGSVLIDSGGQYLEGTTDLTRTLPLGEITKEFKKDYTTTLKAYINLAMAKFPKGTRGEQLDVLARLPLWKEGKDFMHGTGHGVGSFLNVHEGPQSIRKEHNPFSLQPGMVLSNEPGYYITGKYGIRHENLMSVKEFKETEWNDFYEFETLTYCPFFKEPIIKEMLTCEEIQWLNDYHKTCEKKLSHLLEGQVKDWFFEMVAPI